MRNLWRCTRGSLVLETAFSLIIIIPFVFSLFEVCMMSYTWSTLNDAARQGVRYAISHGTTSSNCSGPSSGCMDAAAANVQSVVTKESKLSGHDVSGLTVAVNYLDASSAPSSRVQVSIQYPYAPFVDYPAFHTNLQVSAEGRIVF